MSETKPRCGCGRIIADNFELRATVVLLEKSYENASSACNRVADERDKLRVALKEIVDIGELGSNLPQDGRMYDIAKAALEI